MNARKTSLSVAFGIVVSGFVGCGSDSAGTLPAVTIGSCTISGGGATTCIDYTGTGITSLNAVNLCANTEISSTPGTYNAAAKCSATGEVGKCVTNAGTSSEQTFHYLTGWTNSAAQTSCTSSAFSGAYSAG